MNQTHAAARSAIGLAAGSIAALTLLTRPLLPELPLSHPEHLEGFLRLNGAVVTAAAMLRVLAIAGAAYVLVVAVLALFVAVGRPGPRILRIVRSLTLPMLRFALPGTLGVCLLAAPVTAASPVASTRRSTNIGVAASIWVPAASDPAGDHADDLVLLSGAPTTSTTVIPTGTSSPSTIPDPTESADPAHPSSETATFRVDESPSSTIESRPTTTRPDEVSTTAAPTTRRATIPTERTRRDGRGTSSSSTSSSPTTRPSRRRRVAPPAVAVTPPRPAKGSSSPNGAASVATTWTVRPGDHLWRIAQDTLAARLGRTPTDAEVVPYWRRVIDENRARLVDPDNPDLILPGQVVALP